MSSVNNSPNHFMILYTISGGMNSQKKGFFDCKKERNNE
jgi:hypothetical protein